MTHAVFARDLRADLGLNIRHRREDAGLAVEHLAARCGIARDRLAAIEAGADLPTALEIEAVMGRLRCGLDALFGWPRAERLPS